PFPLTAPPHIYTLSLHDALPISEKSSSPRASSTSLRWSSSVSVLRVTFSVASTVRPAISLRRSPTARWIDASASLRACSDAEARSEEHTSELQSRGHLVCRLLLE